MKQKCKGEGILEKERVTHAEHEADREMKRVSDSYVETIHMVRPNHLNSAGRLFGGILMQWIDEVAGLVAKRHAHTNITTASVDNLRFLKGAYQGGYDCHYRETYVCWKYIDGSARGYVL